MRPRTHDRRRRLAPTAAPARPARPRPAGRRPASPAPTPSATVTRPRRAGDATAATTQPAETAAPGQPDRCADRTRCDRRCDRGATAARRDHRRPAASGRSSPETTTPPASPTRRSSSASTPRSPAPRRSRRPASTSARTSTGSSSPRARPDQLFGRNVRVVFRDDEFNPQHAVQVCREMVEQEGRSCSSAAAVPTRSRRAPSTPTRTASRTCRPGVNETGLGRPRHVLRLDAHLRRAGADARSPSARPRASPRSASSSPTHRRSTTPMEAIKAAAEEAGDRDRLRDPHQQDGDRGRAALGRPGAEEQPAPRACSCSARRSCSSAWPTRAATRASRRSGSAPASRAASTRSPTSAARPSTTASSSRRRRAST